MKWSRSWSLVLLVVACAPETAVTFEGVLQEHRDAAPEDHRSCGRAAVGNDCREALSEAEACFADAFDNCEAAEIRLDVTGIDAGFDVAVFIDVATDGSCRISRFTDHSADEFKGDYGDFVEEDCTGLEVQEFDPDVNACAGIRVTDCSTRQEWYE